MSQILKKFKARIPNAFNFALKNRIVLIKTSNGCEADISLGLPGYEEEVIKRTVAYDLGDGRAIKLCSAEDLIIHKLIAARPQDNFDVESVVLRQGKRLNINYIRRWLKAFAQILENKEILERFNIFWRNSIKSKKSKSLKKKKDKN